MNRFLNWIIYTVILVLIKSDFSKSERKQILGLDIAEVAELWKKNINALNTLLKFSSKDARAKGESFPKEKLPFLKRLMKFFFVVNKQLEYEVIKISSTSQEFQHWQQSMKKAIKRVYQQIFNIIENVGMKPLDPSSIEKMRDELENNLTKALALTILLQKSNHAFEDRAVQGLWKMFEAYK